MNNLSPRNKGFLIGFLMVALSLFFFYVLKEPLENNYRYIIPLILAYAAGIIWCLIDFKKQSASTPTFKDYFSISFKMFVVVTLIMVLFVFFFFYLNPEIRDDKFAENNRLLLLEGNHTPAEIERNSEAMKGIFLPMMMGITTFVFLSFGSLITTITSGFLSQKK